MSLRSHSRHPALPLSISELLRGKTIYLVDDDDEQLEIVRAYLKPYKELELRCFQAGKQAIDQLRYQLPDLVLLDVMLPDFDGWEIYNQLRKFPGGADLPVIFITCLADGELEREMADGGRCVTLAKPMTKQRLLETISRLLKDTA